MTDLSRPGVLPIYAGVMSGTSLDGIDVAFAGISVLDPAPERPRFEIRFLGGAGYPFAPSLRERVLRLRAGDPLSVAETFSLHFTLAGAYADAVVEAACECGGIVVADLAGVGLHGQTVWHAPPSSGAVVPATLQLGQPAVLAERLRAPIVADFRARDIAAGGEGAPLVPFADFLLLASSTETRAMLNLGGIANLTYLPAGGGLADILAFDTGPGCMVIDGAMSALTGAPFDAAGALAAHGTPDLALASSLLDHPYFDRTPPKTTGAELFGPHFVAEFLDRAKSLCLADTLATAAHITVESVARAIRMFLPQPPACLVLGGGGVRNEALVAGLGRALPGVRIETHETYDVPSQSKEALAFAILAAATLNRVPGNVPSATGASCRRVLGSVTYP